MIDLFACGKFFHVDITKEKMLIRYGLTLTPVSLMKSLSFDGMIHSEGKKNHETHGI